MVLFVARNLLSAYGIPLGKAEPIPAEVYEKLNLDQDRAEEVIADLVEARDEILRMAGMLEPE